MGEFIFLQHWCIPVNFAKFLKTIFYTIHFGNCFWSSLTIPTAANIYLFKVKNRNTKGVKYAEVNSKNIRTTSMRSFWVFLLSLNIFTPFSDVSIVDFEQVNVSWEADWLIQILLKHEKFESSKKSTED